MKKRRQIIIYSLIFLALILGEAYCLLNRKGDFVTVIGIGVVLLIFAYLLLDSLFSYFTKPDSKDIEAFASSKEEEERFRKLSLMIEKKGFATVQRQLMELCEQQKKELEEVKKELLTGMKVGMKYDRENTKQIIESNHADLEKISEQFMEIGKLLKEYKPLDKTDIGAQLAQALGPILTSLTTKEGPVVTTEEVAITDENPSEIGKDFEEDKTLTETEMIQDTIDNTEEWGELEPSLDPQLELGPNLEIESEELEPILEPVESLNLEPEQKEKEPEPATPDPVITPDSKDANKMMSADEIAALIASMGK